MVAAVSPDEGASGAGAGGARTAGVRVQAVVIGAGQAGLVAAHELARRGLEPGRDFVVLDAAEGPGGAWRERWDSLTFDRAHGIADLPGLPLPAPDPREPSSRVVSRYFADYESTFDLHVVRPATVLAVRSSPEAAPPLDLSAPPHAPALAEAAPSADGSGSPVDPAAPAGGGASGGASPSSAGPGDAIARGTWLDVDVDVAGERRTYVTRLVISATGTWSHPFIPYVPGAETFGGWQLHTVDFVRARDFAGERVVVVGGGLSAVQFLLQIAPVAASTVWATRQPPNFTRVGFDAVWGADVEQAVDQRTGAGLPPASVVRTTGIPMEPEYLRGVADGVLVSRGMFDRVGERRVRFSPAAALPQDDPRRGGLGPSAPSKAESGRGPAVPESWQPYGTATWVDADVLFWNTGFRPAIGHLAPLQLREAGGGIRLDGRVAVARDPRVLMVGYGASASTRGAAHAGREAGRLAVRRLGL